MKKLGTVITAVFVIMAAVLGWFLPLAAFNVEDSLTEGRERKLAIEPINLSYRDDLAINQKINVINYEYNLADAIKIDKGIYNQKEDINRIFGDFLADFTGYRFDINYGMYATPMLVNLANNRGTIVIWVISCPLLNDWSVECYIDDKTGAILHCNFYGNGGSWSSLVLGSDEYTDPEKPIAERFSNALYNHYVKTISAKLVTYNKVMDSDVDDLVSYRLIFRDSKNYTFQITVNVGVSKGYIETF